ncbi:MAG: Gldg family protein, partial [Clostridia bacterium]|nr:Gldg family protein [Clostridia bacterium]
MKNRRIKFGTQTLLLCAALAAVLAAVNVLVGFLPKSVTYADLTSQKLYTIDPQTESVVQSLDKDIDVYLVAQTGSEDDGIKIMLEKYKLLSPKLHVGFVDPVVNPNFVGKYTNVSLNENSLIVECKETGRTRTIDYTEIYAMIEDESIEMYNLTGEYYPDTFCLEDRLTSAINYMVTDKLPEILFLSGHGESDP